MDKKDCFYLGKITKPFGYKGELVFWFDVDEPLNYKEYELRTKDNDRIEISHAGQR